MSFVRVKTFRSGYKTRRKQTSLFGNSRFSKNLKTARNQLNDMKFEVSIGEELDKVKAEIRRLERYKRVLEDALASELLKR